jgi:large conductance mechanosensitive channel
MLKDFKAFIMKGNVVDMAVGIIIGVAFGAVIASLVKDVLMPPIGLALGKIDFSSLAVSLKEGSTPGPYASLAAAQAAGAVTLNYGLFINTIVNFLIIAFCLLLCCPANCQNAGPEEGERTCSARGKRLSILCDSYSYQGQALPELHFRTGEVVRICGVELI